MFKFYNANPKGKLTGDCVKRAISTATGVEYSEVQKGLNRHKRANGLSRPNTKDNWLPYMESTFNLEKLDKDFFKAVAGEPRMHGSDFMRMFPKGRYILRMAHHLTCCIDGDILDTWDCSDKTVYMAWRVNTVK